MSRHILQQGATSNERSDQSALISPHVFQEKKKSKNQNKKIKKTKHETVSQDKKKKHIATQSLVYLGFVLLGFGSLKRQKKVKTQYQSTDITFSLRVGCKCEMCLDCLIVLRLHWGLQHSGIILTKVSHLEWQWHSVTLRLYLKSYRLTCYILVLRKLKIFFF